MRDTPHLRRAGGANAAPWGGTQQKNISSVEPYRELVTQLVKENVEIAAIRERLKERGYTGFYSAVRPHCGLET
jgi:hypothetical protein